MNQEEARAIGDQTPDMTREQFRDWWFALRDRPHDYYDDEFGSMRPERCTCEQYPFPHWAMETRFGVDR